MAKRAMNELANPHAIDAPRPRGALSTTRLTRGRLVGTLCAGMLLLVIVSLVVLHLGPEVIAPRDLFRALFTRDESSPLHAILFELRLPRIILAASAGGALACTGVLFQALLRNPLAEPYILGISNGCAVGAIVGYMIGAGSVMQPLLAFAGGGVAVMAVLAISRGSFGERSESMLLGGVMVGAIGAAIIFLLLHFLGPQLRSAIQWMLGDLSSTSATIGYWSSALFALLLGVSLASGDLLNLLALGDEEAASLGVNVPRARAAAYVIGSIFVGASVAFCGAIGFVGLVVPHILRRTFGPDHRALLPLSVIGGGIFLVVCDTIARSLMPAIDSTASELPVGAITALVGAPLFIALLRRGSYR